MTSRFIICVLAALLLASPARADELRLAGPEFPPHWVMENGRLTGTVAEILIRIVERAGYAWTGETYPAARLMRMLAAGEAQASLLVRNQTLDTSPDVLRSTEPITEDALNAYGIGGASPIARREDLTGRRVIVMRGYGYGGLREWMDANGVKIFEVDSYQNALRLLEVEQTAVAILYDVNFEEGVKALGHTPANVVTTYLQGVPLYIYLHRSAGGDGRATMDGLVNAWRDLVAKGVLARPGNRPEHVLRQSPR